MPGISKLGFWLHILWIGCQFPKSLLIGWNEKSMRAEVASCSKSELQVLTRKQNLHFFTRIVVLLQGLLFVNQRHPFQKFIWILGQVIWASNWAHSRALNIEPNSVCLYINGLLDFERKPHPFQKARALSRIQVANILLAYGFYLTVIGFPLIYVYAIHGLDPCQPSLAGYWIIPNCNQIWPSSPQVVITILKLIVFIFNHWVWSFGLSAALVAFSGIQILCTMSLHNCLAMLTDNYSCKDVDSVRYRTIQLLATLMNEIIQRELNAVVACSATFLLALCEATLVKLPLTKDNLAELCLFGFLFFNCFLAEIVVFGGYAQVHEMSREVLRKLKSRVVLAKLAKERKLRIRFLRAFSIIKVRLGPINFVEAVTPLKFIDFANCLAVQILLVGRPK